MGMRVPERATAENERAAEACKEPERRPAWGPSGGGPL